MENETKRPRPLKRVYLKIKIKSLAAEATIIRAEERRWPGETPQRIGLHQHRVVEVRGECRAAGLAYGFLRGRSYAAMEVKSHDTPPLARAKVIAEKFSDESAQVTKQRWAEWFDAYKAYRP